MPSWLWKPEFVDVPLFLCHRQLRTRVSPYPKATTRYAVDSGAYSELTRHGRWTETPEQYIAGLRRYEDELGPFDFAGQQDWVCKPEAIAAIEQYTGVRPDVVELLEATVENLLVMRALAPDLKIAPTIQGGEYEDFMLCADLFIEAGVDLTTEPIVGVGSLVGMHPKAVERIATGLRARGIVNLHGFGLKGAQLPVASHGFDSADSLSWSMAGRYDPLPDCPHKQCQNCPRYALAWRNAILGSIEGPQQLAFAI
jgi:hypothetical protein